MRKQFVFMGIIQIMICLVANNSFGATYYNIKEITGTGFNKISGLDINNNSMVTGLYRTDLEDGRGFVYENGVLTDMGLEQDTAYQIAYEINDSGFVAGGRYLNASNMEKGILYNSSSDTYVDIPSSTNTPTNWTWAYGINNSNQVTGYEIITSTGERFAFIYENGVTTLLPQIGGERTEGYAINDQGHVAGFGYDASNQYANSKAYFYDGTIAHNLGTLGGSTSFAHDINESDMIVGDATVANGDVHAFVWSDNVMTDLGTFGGTYSSARSINESGQVVGRSYINETDKSAFVYTDGVMYDLNDYIVDPSDQVVLTLGSSINDYGDILAVGTFGSDTEIRTYILTPVPEPLSIILTSIGLGVLALRKKY